jgi:hypothetical protein
MCPDEATMINDVTKLKDLGWKEIALRWIFSQGVTTVLLFAIGAFMWIRYPEIMKEQDTERANVLKRHEDERERIRLDAKEERKLFREDLKEAFTELKEAIEKSKI